MRPVNKGDCFLLPFSGTRRELLVTATGRTSCGQHECRNVHGNRSYINLDACRRIGPVEAKRIAKVKEGKCG